MLTFYTTYESVRAVLGVTNRVLPDSVLDSEVYLLALRADLRQVGHNVSLEADLDQDYLDMLGSSLPTESATLAVYHATRLFATHSVAVKLMTAMPELSPTYISDSKAALRKDKSGTLPQVVGDYAKYRRLLVVAYAAFLDLAAPAVYQPNLLGAARPDFDPVIGR